MAFQTTPFQEQKRVFHPRKHGANGQRDENQECWKNRWETWKG